MANWIDPQDLRDAIAHGERINDPANNRVRFRHDGMVYVTEADGKTPISANAESEPAKAAEALARAISAAYTSTPCEGQRDFDEWQRKTGRYDEYPNWFAWENAALDPGQNARHGFGGGLGGSFGGGGFYDDDDDDAYSDDDDAPHREPVILDDDMFRRLMRRRAGGRPLAEGFEFMSRATQRIMRPAVEAQLRGQEAAATEILGKISQLDPLEKAAKGHSHMPQMDGGFSMGGLAQQLRGSLEGYGLREWPRLTTAEVRESLAQFTRRAANAERKAEQHRREAEAKAEAAKKEAQMVCEARKAGDALPAGGAEWFNGCCAIVHGLQGRQDLNGLAVEILAWDGSKGRWATRVASTAEGVAVKPANLQLAPDDWPLCSEAVPEARRRAVLFKLLRKLAADPTKPWREGMPDVSPSSASSYTEQEPPTDWQPPATLDAQRKLAHDFVIYGEAGEWARGRYGGSFFKGRCAPAGPPLVQDLIALARELDANAQDRYGKNKDVCDVLQAMLTTRGVQPKYPCGYAPFADPLIVKCARRGDHLDRQMIRALAAEGMSVETCLQWEEVQEKMGGYTKEWTWNGDTALMAAAKRGNLAAVKTLLQLGAKNEHQCCYADDEYDKSASAAAKRKGQQAAAELIENYTPEVPSLLELAAQQMDAEELASLPESVQAAAVDCV